MVAPGQYYDLQEGPQFRDRTRGQKALIMAVHAEVRRRFDQMELRMDGVKIGMVIEGGQNFSFAVARKPGNKVVLLQIWETDTEALDEARLQQSLKGSRP